jgi:D-alanyl-lipoteichoic acid acyltransferase DltB (MBOAT superfamily)
MSGILISSSTVSGVTLPPYWITMLSAALVEYLVANQDRMYLVCIYVVVVIVSLFCFFSCYARACVCALKRNRNRKVF